MSYPDIKSDASTVQLSRFYAVENLPINIIQKYKNATSSQIKYAKAFDTDNNGIFSQQEADLFNATTFVERNNTVFFDTQVEKKGFWRTTTEKVRSAYTGNLNNIKYDTNNKLLKNKKIIPYKKTHYKLEKSNRDVWPDAENINGIKIEVRTANSYSEIYYNNKYMNCVTLKDGTRVIYPNGENGSIESHNQGGAITSIEYTYGFGYDIKKGNYTNAGNGGYKMNTEYSKDNYYTTFQNVNNAFILGSNAHNRYELNNCSSCVVNSSNDGKTPDNIFIKGGKKNSVIQGQNDVTRIAMSDFDVLINGKKNINIDKLKNESKDVKYERYLFKPNKWIGVKNNSVQYTKEQLESIKNWK